MDALQVEWREAFEGLGERDHFITFATSKCDRVRLEKFFSDNYDLMDEKQRRFVSISLRVKLQKEAEEQKHEQKE